MKNRDQLLDYWLRPEPKNAPEQYLTSEIGAERSAWMVRFIERRLKLSKESTILELGCNAGRNLLHLWEAGYKRLSAIELNPEAVALMRKAHPEISAQIYVGTIEEILPQLGTYDLIFTMAVLVHLHPSSEWVFADVASRAWMFLLTIEDEKTATSDRHCPRNYKDIFEGLGTRQVATKRWLPGLSRAYVARVFVPTRT